MYIYMCTQKKRWQNEKKKKTILVYLYTPLPLQGMIYPCLLASWPRFSAKNFINETTENWKKTKKLLLLQTELGRENERLK